MAAWSDKEIKERSDAATDSRKAIQPIIDQCMTYGMPWRKDPRKGRVSFDQLFDSSGPSGVQTFSKRISSDLTPPFQRWFEMKTGPLHDENSREAIDRELSLVTQVLSSALDASNFQLKSEEMYADLSAGTGALLGLEGDDYDPIVWHSVPPWALGIEEGPSGRIDNAYWQRSYPAHQLKAKWPRAVWPQKILDIIANKPLQKVEILQGSYFDSVDRLWRMHVMVCGEADGLLTVYENTHRTNPWIIPRWWTTSGDPWGRGPLMLALPDIKTVNKTVEMILRAAAYQLSPPLMVLHDGVVNPDTLRLAPQSLIKVARTGGPMGRSIEPLNMGSNVNLAQLVLQDERGMIQKHLLAKQLPPQTGAVRSPTEIMERIKEFAFETGSSFGRLNHEFVPGVIARTIDILDRKKVALIDWNKLKIDQLFLKVQVVSPLARTQALEDVQNTIRFYELVKALGGDELLAMIAPLENALVKVGDALGVPAWGTRPKADRDAMQKAAGEALAQQAAAQQMGAQQGAPAAAPVQTGAPLRLVQ